MSTKRFPIISAVLYFLASLLMLYTIWAAVRSFNVISEMVAQNQLVVRGNEFDIISFHMTNFAQYALFAVILFTLGWMIHKYLPVPADLWDDDFDDEDDEEEEDEAEQDRLVVAEVDHPDEEGLLRDDDK
jgi:hypothetical protein